MTNRPQTTGTAAACGLWPLSVSTVYGVVLDLVITIKRVRANLLSAIANNSLDVVRSAERTMFDLLRSAMVNSLLTRGLGWLTARSPKARWLLDVMVEAVYGSCRG